MQWSVTVGGKSSVVQIPDNIPDNAAFDATIDGRSVQLRWQRHTRALFIKDLTKSNDWAAINIRSKSVAKFPGEGDIAVSAEFSAAGASDPINMEAIVSVYFPGQDSKEGSRKKKPAVVRSQITGKVLKIMVNAGDIVSAGDTLMIIEAMKMENRVLANTGGVIDAVKVKELDTVASGAELLKFK